MSMASKSKIQKQDMKLLGSAANFNPKSKITMQAVPEGD